MVKPIKIILDDPHYYPGSAVKGIVLVCTDKPKQYQDITIEIFGYARARWTESTGYKQYTVFQNTLRYIEQKCVLWSKKGAPTESFPAGQHSFPFSLQLPNEAPPSFKSFTGKIIYKMKAKITQSSMLKFDLHNKVIVDVKSYIPRLCMQPKNAELNSVVTFCCCFNYGEVNVNCSLPQSGFALGDSMPLTMQVENQTNKCIYIRASISKRIIYLDSDKGHTKSDSSDNLSVLRSRSVPAGTTALLEDNVLHIPRKLPLSTRCPAISVKYFLVIQARSVVGSSEKMKIPIVIAHASPPLVDQQLVDQVPVVIANASPPHL